MKKTFGSFLREKRLALGLSLREFAGNVGMQPSNYCNIEADVLPPPPVEGLVRIAKALGIRKGMADYVTLHDLSGKGRDEIPADIEKMIKGNELIPAMLRTVEDEKVTKEQLLGIIKDLKSGRYKAKAKD